MDNYPCLTKYLGIKIEASTNALRLISWQSLFLGVEPKSATLKTAVLPLN